MDFAQFVESHWGDLVGLLLIYTGIVVMFVASGYGVDAGIADSAGKGLVGAGLVALKLRSGKNTAAALPRRSETLSSSQAGWRKVRTARSCP